MSKLTGFIALSVLLLFCCNNFAQDGHYYTIITWKISVPDGGSRDEFKSLMKEWHDKVISKNEKIISERALRHESGNDMRDWLFITEYTSWNDIDAASKRNDELVEAAWPDKDQRKNFFDKFWKYVDTHSDEILTELPELRK